MSISVFFDHNKVAGRTKPQQSDRPTTPNETELTKLLLFFDPTKWSDGRNPSNPTDRPHLSATSAFTFCTILSSKCGRCHARRFSSRWAVLAVLPIEEKKVSGSRCRIFTIKSFCCQNSANTTLGRIDSDGTYFCISHCGQDD